MKKKGKEEKKANRLLVKEKVSILELDGDNYSRVS